MERSDEHLLARLRQRFPTGTSLGSGCTVAEVREADGNAVVMVRWERDPHLYGIPVPLDDASRDFYYTDDLVASPEEYLDSVSFGLTILVDTGLRADARRTQVDDYIELRASGGWPFDERFYYVVVDPADPLTQDQRFVAAAEHDPTPALDSRDSDRLIGWVTGYENNSMGKPYVGQVVVCWSSDTTAHLEHVVVADGVPITVLVDLAHLAAHAAGVAGALTVTTDLDQDELAVVGFRVGPDGQRFVETSFLDEDPAGAARLLEETSAGRWGQDRDAAGRYLPGTRVGRWWHRLRHGSSGALPRRYVG